MLSWPVSLTVFFVSKAMMSLKTSLAGAATAIGLTALAYPAQAAQFSFTYNDAANMIVLSGILTGTATGNIIEIDGFSNLVYNGVPLNTTIWESGTTVSDYGGFFNMPNPPAQASFDGSVMNFVLVANGTNDYIGFGTGEFEELGNPAFISNFPDTGMDITVPDDLMGVEEAFNQPGWNLQLIPEPSAVVGLLGLGLGALASKVIKKG
ncbi:PEP-CTERM sorting domain-containing protein [Microcystis sp. MC19]|uniref:PEP-CTERM sorting domain-containing protein n=1 Tax=Microcystis sp. MC19 TaxID=1967666 RepID=UPI000D11A1C9|nr:PEP-CTERM sorting domain-containing protein [Microcystis sp. MC19]AVQ70071.1 PEP-CTERM sorting domain-containing protein [Microcystis sp. MC19]